MEMEEAKAIASLERLAKKWPSTLKLVSCAGSLRIVKHVEGCDDIHVVANIDGIPNDGGDPDECRVHDVFVDGNGPED